MCETQVPEFVWFAGIFILLCTFATCYLVGRLAGWKEGYKDHLRDFPRPFTGFDEIEVPHE